MAAVLVVATLLSACTGAPARPSTIRPVAATKSTSSTSCVGAIETRPLPEWARSGFTPPEQAAPQLTGARKEIVGVVFGTALHSPPLTGLSNKILWIGTPDPATSSSPDASPDLRINATLNGSDVTVQREVSGGPGPSIIDMPRAGCWIFTLAWRGHRDQLAVPYSG